MANEKDQKIPSRPETVRIISSRIARVEAVAVMEPSSARGNQKSVNDRRSGLVPKAYQDITEISVDAFEANIRSTTDALSQIFEGAFESEFGDFRLDTVEVALEISADGKVGFMGTGLGISGSSSLKLTFNRKK